MQNSEARHALLEGLDFIAEQDARRRPCRSSSRGAPPSGLP
jgi:hypothetical protein